MDESYVVYIENDVGKHHTWFATQDDAIMMANIMLDSPTTTKVYIGTIRWTSNIPYTPRYRVALAGDDAAPR